MEIKSVQLKKLYDSLKKKVSSTVWEELEPIFAEVAPNEADSESLIWGMAQLRWIDKMPWKETPESTVSFNFISKELQKSHTGMDAAVQLLLEYMAGFKRSANQKTHSLLFHGVPGTGKTSLSQAIARALKRPVYRIFLGGARDVDILKGTRKSVLGSGPGYLLKAFCQTNCQNPIIILDELDKVANPAIYSLLLEILDPEQNKDFRDNFVELPFDVSKAFFIATANDLSNIPDPLLNRLELVELSPYSAEEKVIISRNHLIPAVQKEYNLAINHFSFTNAAIKFLIESYTNEGGVRKLTSLFFKLGRKVAKQSFNKKRTSPNKAITPQKIIAWLGPEIYQRPKKINLLPGFARGLGASSDGTGSVLTVESVLTPSHGKSKIKITGLPGQVLKESAQVVLTLLKYRAETLKIDETEFKKDIHIHFPEASSSGVEGPSAGITMFVALYSAYTQKPMRQDTVMTGEITLQGAVKEIGGLKSKAMAASQQGFARIVFPKENLAEFLEFSKTVNITGVAVETVEELLKEVF